MIGLPKQAPQVPLEDLLKEARRLLAACSSNPVMRANAVERIQEDRRDAYWRMVVQRLSDAIDGRIPATLTSVIMQFQHYENPPARQAPTGARTRKRAS
jgi:hypothetical protein